MEAEETLETLAEEQETCQQMQTELQESKQIEQALAERVLRPEREIQVVKAAMVDLQQTLHVGLKVAATTCTNKLEKLTSLVEICIWRYPDERWIGT